MKAITIDSSGTPLIEEREMPKLRPSYMLVAPQAYALNPYDSLGIDYGFAKPGMLLGCDFAGTVVEVDDADTTRRWKKGERVCGFTRSTDPHQPENGAFADCICAKADLMYHIPEHLSFEEASAMGVTIVTIGRAMFDKFGIKYPRVNENGLVDTKPLPERQILIYGGSSCLGTMAIQLAKLSNFYVVTVCSPTNFDLVRSYGADFVVDYKSPTAVEDLLAQAKSNEQAFGALTLCVDCISNTSSSEFCYKVLNPEKMRENYLNRQYSAVMPWTVEMPGVTKFETLGYSFCGEPWGVMDHMFPASKQDFESSRQFSIVVEHLLKLGKIKPHPVDARKGGLLGIVEQGLQNMRAGVSGKKIVYTS